MDIDTEARRLAHHLLTASDEELRSGASDFPKVSFEEACRAMETFGQAFRAAGWKMSDLALPQERKEEE